MEPDLVTDTGTPDGPPFPDFEDPDLVDWRPHAEQLAVRVTRPTSRWRPVVAEVPRHVFVRNWWRPYQRVHGPYGTSRWKLATWRGLDAGLGDVFADRSLVTQVGGRHADAARLTDTPLGIATSSATLPSLLLSMFRHAELDDGLDVLDVGTGSGYGTALLATRLGAGRVTSVDVDAHLVDAARYRLERVALRPALHTVDATAELPGAYDRIVATVSVRPLPGAWLAALRPGGRLVTTIAGTGLILTADATGDGGAAGRIEWDRAGFMAARTGADYPREVADLLEHARTGDGDETRSPFPVVNVPEAWELWSMLTVTAPGIEHDHHADQGLPVAVMAHPDGSWARAESSSPGAPARVVQGGPRRLWDMVDELRERWLRDGSLPVYGARATITPDGAIELRRGSWTATIT